MIDADSADDARARFEACEAPEPCASEVTDVEITAVEKVET